jgi:hypothetical protein
MIFASASAFCSEASFIQVLDDQTQRPVPMVELKTINGLKFYTDNNGIVAFCESGLLNKEVFFFISSHGYEYPKDDFGFNGVKVGTKPGKITHLKIKRINLAQRLYRITGGKTYSESMAAGLPVPIKHSELNASVLGQDSALAILYKKKIYWFWGDTSFPDHPLGLFKVCGATSLLSADGGLDPNNGIDLSYFADGQHAKAMFPFDAPGAIWIDGVLTVKKDSNEKLLAHYERVKRLGEIYEHGLAIFDDKAEIFHKIKELDLKRKWQCPKSHPVKYTDEGIEYFVFPSPFASVRVRADYDSLLDPNRYQAFTCLKTGTTYDKERSQIDCDPCGNPVYGWKFNTEPIGTGEEAELIKLGIIAAHHVRFQPSQSVVSQTIKLTSGSLNWNQYRRKWIIIASQIFGTSSVLGEVWYCESNSICGPWETATKIVSHNKYSFYNPVHHVFFDQDGGRTIYFEGTYSNMFSGNDCETPRYNYNQIMYKLDLSKFE